MRAFVLWKMQLKDYVQCNPSSPQLANMTKPDNKESLLQPANEHAFLSLYEVLVSSFSIIMSVLFSSAVY